MRSRLQFLLLAVGAFSCSTTSKSSIPGGDDAVVMRTLPVSAWSVEDDGESIGFVVRYEAPSSADKAYFSVRNRHQQELGIVDTTGRTWRHRPHQREPDWLGTGTILQGVQRVLGASERAVLVDTTLESLLRTAAPGG